MKTLERGVDAIPKGRYKGIKFLNTTFDIKLSQWTGLSAVIAFEMRRMSARDVNPGMELVQIERWRMWRCYLGEIGDLAMTNGGQRSESPGYESILWEKCSYVRIS